MATELTLLSLVLELLGVVAFGAVIYFMIKIGDESNFFSSWLLIIIGISLLAFRTLVDFAYDLFLVTSISDLIYEPILTFFGALFLAFGFMRLYQSLKEDPAP